MCWMSATSVVPSMRCEISSDRTMSSVTMPPALRMMWASPMWRPRSAKRSRRASMQATTAIRRTGAAERSSGSKCSA